MGNCLSSETSINGRSKSEVRRAKSRPKRSKRRPSMADIPAYENPLNHQQQQVGECEGEWSYFSERSVLLGSEGEAMPFQNDGEGIAKSTSTTAAPAQVESLQISWKGGAPMVSCEPPSSTKAAGRNSSGNSGEKSPSSPTLSEKGDGTTSPAEASWYSTKSSGYPNLEEAYALSNNLEAMVDCPTPELLSASASTRSAFTPPAISASIITAWLSGLGKNSFGIAPSPQSLMSDLDPRGRVAAASPQVLSERTLKILTRSLAMMNGGRASSPTGSSVAASVSQQPSSQDVTEQLMYPVLPSPKQRHANAESPAKVDDQHGSSTDDFSSLEKERLSWLLSQEDLNTIQPAIATPTPSNKTGSTSGSFRPPGNRTPRNGRG